MATTQIGETKITFYNILYVPSYQANLVSQALLQKQGAFYRPESQEIIHNSKHLCKVIL